MSLPNALKVEAGERIEAGHQIEALDRRARRALAEIVERCDEPRLRAIRNRVVEDAAGFTKVRKNKKLVATYGDLQEEGKLQRPPKGFDPDTPNIEYVKLKSFIVWTEEDIRKKIPADLGKQVLEGFKDAYPLVQLSLIHISEPTRPY